MSMTATEVGETLLVDDCFGGRGLYYNIYNPCIVGYPILKANHYNAMIEGIELCF